MVDDPGPAYRQVEELTEPVIVSGRSHAGFNPATKSNVKLFAPVLDGNNPRPRVPEHRHSQGPPQTNRGIRGAATTESVRGPDAEAIARRGLIAKVPHSRRWHVSQKGHRAGGGRATVSLWYSGGRRLCGVDLAKHVVTREEATEVESTAYCLLPTRQ